MKFLVPFFQKRVPFLANTKCCPKFLEYTLGPQNEMRWTAKKKKIKKNKKIKKW